MQAANPAPVVTIPWAETGSRNTIPTTSQIGVVPGKASWPDGFPPLTMTPLEAGGVPPAGPDFNGILHDLSASLRWSATTGARPYWNGTVASQIGGYPAGAEVSAGVGTGAYWVNTVDNNVAQPGTTNSGWVHKEYANGLPVLQIDALGFLGNPGYMRLPILNGGSNSVVPVFVEWIHNLALNTDAAGQAAYNWVYPQALTAVLMVSVSGGNFNVAIHTHASYGNVTPSSMTIYLDGGVPNGVNGGAISALIIGY